MKDFRGRNRKFQLENVENYCKDNFKKKEQIIDLLKKKYKKICKKNYKRSENMKLIMNLKW